MRALMLIGLAIAACGALPLEAPQSAGPVWCFPAVVEAKEGRAMAGCADTEALCRRALWNARRYGSIAGVVELGSCALMELR